MYISVGDFEALGFGLSDGNKNYYSGLEL